MAQQEIFRRQLAEVLYADIPQSVRARLDELTDEQRQYVVKPMNIKAVFAIRSDRMSLLDSMKDTLPAILHKRYELRSLTHSQAKDAIIKPARIISEDFASPPFEYTEGGLSAIIKALTTTSSEGKDITATGIEAFQLQIVCEYIESLVKEGKVPDLDGNGLPDITEAQLPHMETLYSEYYYRKLQELDPSVKTAAQIVLEDGLLAEDNVSGEGRRMSVDSRALIGQFRHLGLTDDLLLALEKTYLIRREVNTVGGFSFEISHDTLVAPIQKAKKDRKHIEEKALAAQKAAEREEQLTEAKRQADIERNRRIRSNIALLVAVLGLLFAAWQYFNAERAKKEALTQKDFAEKSKNEADLAKNVAIGERIKADSLGKVAVAEADKALQNFKLAEKRAIEAKQNADAATKARQEAENNLKLANEQKGIATDALKQAEVNLQKAKDEEAKALAEQTKTKKALDEAQAANIRVVASNIRDIEQHILKLEYDAALDKCQTALVLNVESQKDTLQKRILEIAYFYTETDTAEVAIKALNLIKQTGFSANAPNIIQNLQAEIRNLSPPQYFEHLEERYYPKMIEVEGGKFKMDSTYEVEVSSFKMAETETTVWQYFLFQRATKYIEPSTPSWQWKGDNPIVNISWYDAAFYLNWLSERRGLQKGYELTNKRGDEPYISYDVLIDYDNKGYRLPTEAEWEFAARGGIRTNSYEYSGSDVIEEVAWYSINSKSQTHSIRTKKANELGLFDMSGNVYEWCSDWYDTYNSTAVSNPTGATKGTSRVLRGGGWGINAQDCRVALRSGSTPSVRSTALGFRVILSP